MSSCALCFTFEATIPTLCDKCFLCSNCSYEYTQSKETLFCLCDFVIVAPVSYIPTFAEISKAMNKLNSANDELKESLESSLKILKEDPSQGLHQKIRESAPFLSENLIDERVLDLVAEVKTKNQEYYKELSLEIDVISSLIPHGQKLLEQYQRVSQTRDLDALYRWYSYLPQHLLYLDRVVNRETKSDYHSVIVYQEIFPVDYKKIGLVAKVYDHETKIRCLNLFHEGKKEIVFRKDDLIIGRYQCVRQSFRDIHYNDQGQKISEVFHTLHGNTVTFVDYLRKTKTVNYMDGRVFAYYPLSYNVFDPRIARLDGWYYVCPEERRYNCRENGRYENGVLVERPYQKPWSLFQLIM